MNPAIEATCKMMQAEIIRADKKHGRMNGLVEGLHTLKCEVAELEREVMREHGDHESLHNEAIQVGAMAIKFIRDCVDREAQ